jgi:hypothetical protein
MQWALNSAVECHLHTVEVIGSNPIAPTIPQIPGLFQFEPWRKGNVAIFSNCVCPVRDNIKRSSGCRPFRCGWLALKR